MADEEDECPIEPFNPLLHPTMISDNHDNETRPHGTKMKAVFKEEEQITSIGAFSTPLVGGLTDHLAHLRLVGGTWRKLAEIY